jgi:hypothetical protein
MLSASARELPDCNAMLANLSERSNNNESCPAPLRLASRVGEAVDVLRLTRVSMRRTRCLSMIVVFLQLEAPFCLSMGVG